MILHRYMYITSRLVEQCEIWLLLLLLMLCQDQCTHCQYTNQVKSCRHLSHLWWCCLLASDVFCFVYIHKCTYQWILCSKVIKQKLCPGFDSFMVQKICLYQLYWVAKVESTLACDYCLHLFCYLCLQVDFVNTARNQVTLRIHTLSRKYTKEH